MRIILSGGGTAGHINPALAIAELLLSEGHEILFVGAKGKMEMERVPKAGFQIVGLPIEGIQRRLTLRNLVVPFKMLKSLSMARRIIKEFRPDVVVGFGGYASAPIVKAAQKKGVRTIIQEQNSYAGLTNRMLAKGAEQICVAYEGMERFFPAEKIRYTGNPLRGSLQTLPHRDAGITHFGLDSNKKTLLIVGGSLGTRTLNEMVLAVDHIPVDLQIIWQCGSFYFEEMQKRATSIKPLPFIERMDMAYAAADAVITRAGASTISELQLIGKPTIFIPSPNVSEDHQTMNARSLVEKGAALMVSDSEASRIAITLATELLNNKTKMEEMAERQREMGKPNASIDIVKLILKQSSI